MTGRARVSRRASAAGLGALAVGLGWLGTAGAALAADIKVGEINSYSALPSFTEPYRKGWQLAVDEINAHGGIGGKTLVVVSRDDAGKPGEALTAANELVSREGVVLLAGGFFSNVGLALGDFAKQHRIVYVAGEPLTDALVWSAGNRYTFRLRPSNYMQAAMLAEEAAKLPAKTWASIAPNYEYGQSAVAVFKKLLSARRPDVTWVAEQWPTQGKIDAGPVAQAIAAAKPDAILNVEFGPDLVKLVREGDTRGLFKGRSVVSFLTGEPEYLDPLKDEAPEGWIVTGYPWQAIHTPAHDAFLKAYQDRYHDHPRLGSVVGYALIQAVAGILRKADSTDPETIVAAAEGLGFDTPFGPASFRAIDHQSTLGAFVGTTARRDGAGVMENFRYVDGAAVLPPDADVKALRPKE
ncbi:ABC transporter substrate-binding protein [Lichenibacterium ramalinae]|uniref:ABC transporter substrate-binding protein n=1 Tax=Lichenibacterium ramalinae TaxID=2316527 RepID=A0A4Q2R7P3_9HYPH|nr:ABC transporter substrate-binding protein [Lichenibacterium ramalinae]RYB02671.1 ABC transporter substrate-binding protein [Lichenibacterium ramalinae]